MYSEELRLSECCDDIDAAWISEEIRTMPVDWDDIEGTVNEIL